MNLNYFNYKPFGNGYLITNDSGKYFFLQTDDFKSLVAGEISADTDLGSRLIEAGIIYDMHPIEFIEQQEAGLRSIKGYLLKATSLHIFVVTTACNMSCIYCQANSGEQKPALFMTEEIACKAVDIALQSPERYLSFEFQGGEPLLNFSIIKKIIEYAENNKSEHCIEYSIVTNLTLLTDEIVDYLHLHHVSISTSIDGPEYVHNCNRCFPDGRPSFDAVSKGIKMLQKAGISVGAIQTTTRTSLLYPEEIVKTYAEFGLDSVFLRPLTPLGCAEKLWDSIGYTPEEYLKFYVSALRSVIDCNRKGVFFRETHAALFLSRIFGQNINYMELRSPCGAGTGQLAYYADGNIFTCDEARMLHEMGDSAFCLGNVWESNYRDLIGNGICKTACASSILESTPSCADCVYQPYCGTCPVVQYAATGDVMEKAPRGYRCKIYMGILDALFEILKENDPEDIRILESWCN